MKKSLLTPFVLVVFMASSAVAAERSVMLEIQNMTCPLCPLTIKKALSKVAGVRQVEIDYEKKLARITFDDVETTAEKLTEAITDAGFPSTVKKP